MKSTWPPQCHLCSRFISYRLLNESVHWIPYGGPIDLDEPEPEYAHRRCWKKANVDGRTALIRRVAWVRPSSLGVRA